MEKAKGQTLEFSSENLDRMKHVQAEIAKAILPYRENTEAALVILALVGAVKILLDLYNPNARAELSEVIVAFLVNDKRSRVVAAPETKSLLSRFLTH